MGSEYWQGLIEWMKKTMLKQHAYISPKDLDVFTIADKPEEAAKIIVDFRESEGHAGLQLPGGMKKG